MKILQFAISLLLCSLTLGCQQNPYRRAPYPRIDSLPIECCSHLTIAENSVNEPPCIPLKNEANVRLPEHVKAYAVNRYIDPANQRIMHERHIMYRIEEDPSWRLATDESKQILIGNTLTDGKLNYNPVLMEKELALELHRQRVINEVLQTHSDTLIDTSAGLNKDHEVMLERSEQFRKALEEEGRIIAELKNRLDLR